MMIKIRRKKSTRNIKKIKNSLKKEKKGREVNLIKKKLVEVTRRVEVDQKVIRKGKDILNLKKKNKNIHTKRKA